jgi:TRAP-type mannitol/chloroaromatic compound transport system substrate-binding protein
MSKRTILDHALPTETNAIINDAFDESTFQTIKQHATTLEESVAEGTEELATFEKLSQDIFSSLTERITPSELRNGDPGNEVRAIRTPPAIHKTR